MLTGVFRFYQSFFLRYKTCYSMGPRCNALDEMSAWWPKANRMYTVWRNLLVFCAFVARVPRTGHRFSLYWVLHVIMNYQTYEIKWVYFLTFTGRCGSIPGWSAPWHCTAPWGSTSGELVARYAGIEADGPDISTAGAEHVSIAWRGYWRRATDNFKVRREKNRSNFQVIVCRYTR